MSQNNKTLSNSLLSWTPIGQHRCTLELEPRDQRETNSNIYTGPCLHLQLKTAPAGSTAGCAQIVSSFQQKSSLQFYKEYVGSDYET